MKKSLGSRNRQTQPLAGRRAQLGCGPLAYRDASLSKLLEDPVTVPIERDGSWFSIDVSGYGAGFEADQLGLPTFYGPNFRMVVSLDKSHGIQIKGVSPLGNGGSLDAFTGVQELSLWQNGELRDFVDFIE
ncbi:MAG: hypothetical protein R3B54_19145 [Bdellovibrionota bacterium]